MAVTGSWFSLPWSARRTRPKGRGKLDPSGGRDPSEPTGEHNIAPHRLPCHLFAANRCQRATAAGAFPARLDDVTARQANRIPPRPGVPGAP